MNRVTPQLSRENKIIQGLWIGPRLSVLEQLSIQSFLDHGHEFHLYVYGPVQDVPHGTVVKDANEVVCASKIFKYRTHDSYAGFSNYFRYKLLRGSGGWWVDLDIICLKAFDFPQEYVFSSEYDLAGDGRGIQINVGAVKCPAESKLMQHLWEECERKNVSELLWGEIGPILFANTIRQFQMESYVVKPTVFCPISWNQWKDILHPDVRHQFSEETYAVHLWNEMWRREGFDKEEPFDESCLFERLKTQYLGAKALPEGGSTTSAPTAQVPQAPGKLSSPTVSAVVLSRNGSKRIARCLESIRRTGFVDELVVCVDSKTTDDTFQLARAFTSHVHVVDTSGYLESALETVTSFCSGDFVLRVDDDEGLGGNWDKASFQLLASYNNATEVWIPTRWMVPPGDSFIASKPWYPDEHPRLYVNDPRRIVWPKKVHEQLQAPGYSIRMFDRWIEHFNLLDRPKGERRRRDAMYRELGGGCAPEYYLYEDYDPVIVAASTPAEALAPARDYRAWGATLYSLDSVIDFSSSGNAQAFLEAGWGDAEHWGTWTIGTFARICLPLGCAVNSGAVVSAEVTPYLNAQHPRLNVEVSYGDEVVAQWTFEQTGFVTRNVEIGADLIAGDSEPTLLFRIKDPRSPAACGESNDGRSLGLHFRSLRLSLNATGHASKQTVTAPALTAAELTARRERRTTKVREPFLSRAIGLGRAALPASDVDVFWEGMWIASVNGTYFPLPDVTTPEAIPWPDLAVATDQYKRCAEDYWYFGYRPKSGDVILDIGAGRGEDVLPFSASVGQSGRVFAVEPHPVSFAALQKFCAWNKLSNVAAIQAACVATPGSLQIESLPNWQSNYVTKTQPTSTSFPVAGVTFDSIWEEYEIGDIDLLKMNIEGAEREALPGARKALTRTRHVCIAAHDFKADRGHPEWYRTGAYVREFLASCGFRITTRENDPRDWARDHVHGSRP